MENEKTNNDNTIETLQKDIQDIKNRLHNLESTLDETKDLVSKVVSITPANLIEVMGRIDRTIKTIELKVKRI